MNLRKVIKEPIVDRLVTPYLVFTYVPSGIKYVEFPFVYDNFYQKNRYYSDEIPLTLDNFDKMRKGNC